MDTKRIILIVGLLLSVSVSASDLQTIRERVLQQVNMSTSGTAQLATAVVDTIIQRGLTRVCRDFPAYVQSEVINLNYQTSSYSLPSDFLEVGWDTLMWCIYYGNSDDTTTYPLPHVPPGAVYAKIIGIDQSDIDNRQTSHIWAFGGDLYVWPAPTVDDDSVLLGYRAVDTALTAAGAGSSLDINPAYWENLVMWVCARSLERVGRYPEAMVFNNEYDKARATQ